MSNGFIPKNRLNSITEDYGFFMDIFGCGRRHFDGMALLCNSYVQGIEKIEWLLFPVPHCT